MAQQIETSAQLSDSVNLIQEERDQHWMRYALQLADEAADIQEVPVGCIVVLDEQIIGRGFNRRETWQDPTAHAEMLALRDASKSIGQWRLIDATVYCTMEPCPMCTGALINARIKRLVFGCSDLKAGCCGSLYDLPQDQRFNHQFDIVSGVLEEEAAEKLRSFFRKRRKQNALRKKKQGEMAERSKALDSKSSVS